MCQAKATSLQQDQVLHYTLHQFQSMTFDLSFTVTFIFNCKILRSFLFAAALVFGNCIFELLWQQDFT